MNGYLKYFGYAKTMCLLLKNKKLLVKYKKVKSGIKQIMKRKQSIVIQCLVKNV